MCERYCSLFRPLYAPFKFYFFFCECKNVVDFSTIGVSKIFLTGEGIRISHISDRKQFCRNAFYKSVGVLESSIDHIKSSNGRNSKFPPKFTDFLYTNLIGALHWKTKLISLKSLSILHCVHCTNLISCVF